MSVRLTWRQLQTPDPERPGCAYADLPRLRVDPASRLASSRVFRWPLADGYYVVAFGDSVGPHHESRYFAETLQVAVDVAEALYEGRPLPWPTDPTVEPEPEEDLEAQLARSLEERDEQRARESPDEREDHWRNEGR